MNCGVTRTIGLSVWLLFVLQLPHASAQTQSLSLRLKAEPTETLARAAREQGNAVRGAILFTQQKLACTRCHAAEDSKRLGPDLRQLQSDVTDESLVESLLQPSKAIRKGFESVTLLTTAGKTLHGRIVDEQPDRITIRIISDGLPLGTDELPRKTLARTEIEEIVPSQLSAMPDNLVDQLENRDEFLDLVRYLMELAASSRTTAPQAQSSSAGGQTVTPKLEGVALLKQFHCSACHRDDAAQSPLTDKLPPDLSWSVGRIAPQFIEQFIADPLHVKPGTTMPDVMGRLSPDERQAAAREITHYLMSLTERSFATHAIEAEAAQRGADVFHSVGCVACHSPRSEDGRELLPESSVPLGPVARKYNLESLVAFLKNPLDVRPSGRMPRMQLTHWEAIDLASYLLSPHSESTEAIGDAFRVDPTLADAGRIRFEQLGCRQCHPLQQRESSPTSVSLAEVNPQRGCLSGEPGSWPQFDLTETQRTVMQAALMEPSSDLSRNDRIALTLTAFRCLNCHQRGALGGVTADRNAYFKTANPNLGPQGRIPPTLTRVGAKLKPEWMRQVLVSGRTIRPYVLTRMPQYGAENVAHLVDLFQEVDHLPPMEFAEFEDLKEMRNVGAEMVGTGGLNCIVCHTFRLKKAANMPAVDLTEMAERLEKNWFYHYMRDPQRLSRNTIMPSFWPGGRAMRMDILEGNTDLQIEALWQYLLDGRQARTPRGLILEPIELLAADEAVMLRRKYPGIGKRGIGVGYPLQVNLAFDAEQMRLAMIWQGKFADPGGVWRGQGHGMVRPLGDKLIRFAPGPDLDDVDQPWIVDDGRPPQHQFLGYSLDEAMRPRFRYRFAGIRVEDYVIDLVDAETEHPFLRRTVALTADSNRSGLRFRAATGETIVRVDAATFLVDDRLRIRIDNEHAGEIIAGETSQQLHIPLQLADGTTRLTLEYRW